MAASLPQRFKVDFDPNSQIFSLAGTIRPRSIDEIAESIHALREAIDTVRGVLYIDVKRLIQMNNTAFQAFIRVALDACRERSDLRLIVITSSVVSWTTRMFRHLSTIEPQISVEVYDSMF